MTKLPQDYYALLGLTRSATQEEIRRAYLKAAKRLHPDKNVGPGETELFMDVQSAYQVLSNPAARKSYDDQLPPEKTIPSVIQQHILTSRKSLSQIKEDQLVYLYLELMPGDEYIGTPKSVQLNICLLLDCSTSMKGEKLDMIKASAIQLIRKLKPQDIFSVVTFNDRAEVVIPATRQANPLKMENIIHQLQPSGGTEILKGLQTGLQEVDRYNNSKFINHIILLTDGHTYGDEQNCYALAKEAASKGIGISGLGLGSDWNDVFLDRLANITAGHSMLVSHPQDIDKLLTEKFTNLSNIFAENVTLEFKLGADTEINYVFRLLPETDPLGCESPIRLGPILHIWPLTVLIEFIIHPRANEEIINLIQGKLEISATGTDLPIPDIPLNISLPIQLNTEPETPPLSIIHALSKLTLYRMQEKARNEMANGNITKATEHLQRLATHLLAQGERSLAKTIIFEIQNIEAEKGFSEQGKKQIKYGTRALVLPEEKNS